MTIIIDAKNPAQLDRLANRLQRTARLQPEKLMDFKSFVAEFQRKENELSVAEGEVTK